MPKIREMKSRDLQKLVKKASSILENRKRLSEDRRKDLDYTEIRKTKGAGKNKVETEEIDMLVTELKGKESAEFTRLAKKYFEANEALKQAKMEAGALNAEIKKMAAPLWDQKDRIHQRLVTTVSYGFLLTAEVENKKTDWEGVVKELEEVLDIETKLLEEIIEKNSKMKKSPERLNEPTAKHKKWMKQHGVGKKQVEESVDLSSMKRSFKKWFKSFKQIVDQYLGIVDQKLDDIGKELGNA